MMTKLYVPQSVLLELFLVTRQIELSIHRVFNDWNDFLAFFNTRDHVHYSFQMIENLISISTYTETLRNHNRFVTFLSVHILGRSYLTRRELSDFWSGLVWFQDILTHSQPSDEIRIALRINFGRLNDILVSRLYMTSRARQKYNYIEHFNQNDYIDFKTHEQLMNKWRERLF